MSEVSTDKKLKGKDLIKVRRTRSDTGQSD